MASSYPLKKNTSVKIVFPILDADGDLVSSAAALDSEYSLDGGAFSDCTNEATEIGSTGIYHLTLTAGETNGDVVCIQVKTTTSGAKTTVLVFYTSAQTLDELDTVCDAVKAKTDNLPTDPADQSLLVAEHDETLAAVNALNDLSAAQVNAEVDTALADIDLDHLIQVTAGAEEPTDGSYLDQIMHKNVSQTFDPTTDSLEALRDRGDAAWITATGFSTHAAADIWTVGTRALTDKAGFSLSATGIDSIIDEVIEGTITLRQAIRLTLSMLASESSGGGTTTLNYRDYGDTKNRLTFTVDANGNRTAVVRDVT